MNYHVFYSDYNLQGLINYINQLPSNVALQTGYSYYYLGTAEIELIPGLTQIGFYAGVTSYDGQDFYFWDKAFGGSNAATAYNKYSQVPASSSELWTKLQSFSKTIMTGNGAWSLYNTWIINRVLSFADAGNNFSYVATDNTTRTTYLYYTESDSYLMGIKVVGIPNQAGFYVNNLSYEVDDVSIDIESYTLTIVTDGSSSSGGTEVDMSGVETSLSGISTLLQTIDTTLNGLFTYEISPGEVENIVYYIKNLSFDDIKDVFDNWTQFFRTSEDNLSLTEALNYLLTGTLQNVSSPTIEPIGEILAEIENNLDNFSGNKGLAQVLEEKAGFDSTQLESILTVLGSNITTLKTTIDNKDFVDNIPELIASILSVLQAVRDALQGIDSDLDDISFDTDFTDLITAMDNYFLKDVNGEPKSISELLLFILNGLGVFFPGS